MNTSLKGYAARQLKRALGLDFDQPVTAYLVNAQFSVCCCLGQVYHHVRARPDGWFEDGHRIRTSDILQVDQWPEFWALHTQSGSYYVVLTFAKPDGRDSLDQLLALLERGVYPSIRGYQ